MRKDNRRKKILVITLIVIMATGIFACIGSLAAQEQNEDYKLTASDGEICDRFGEAVSISGDYAIIGAPCADVDGHRFYGAAYIFKRANDTWVEQTQFLPADIEQNQCFGQVLAINGDTAIIGVDNDNHSGPLSGAAYIYRRIGENWIEEAKITASDAAPRDLFGYSVSISGDTAIVGAYGDDDHGEFSGSAYVFRYKGISWIQEAKLTPEDAVEYHDFGYTVAISGDTAVIGAPGDDDIERSSGAAYVFKYYDGNWIQEAKLKANDAAFSDRLGKTLAISGDTIIIGVPYHDFFGENSSGCVYAFKRTGGIWGQEAKLVASDPVDCDVFGVDVAISGDTVVIGMRHVDDNNYNYSGAGYVFKRVGNNWIEQYKLIRSDCDEGLDDFGYTVAISGDTVIMGAPGECWRDAGAAYVFDIGCIADIDGDGDVDQSDLGILLAAWDSSPGDDNWDYRADIDGDGHVGQSDLGILLANWGCGA